MCIECKTLQDYVPSGAMFLNNEEKKSGCDMIPKFDSEERESEDSVTATIAGTEIVSSSQACKDAIDCEQG